MNYPYQISVIVPSYNEDESLPELCDWITRVCTQHELTFEVIMVDDGSTDNTWNVIQSISQKNSLFKGIKFRRNYGKAAALQTGFEACSGQVIITMDADLQDSPDEIPELYQMVVKDGFDLVSGWKKKRYDNKFTKNLPSKLYNWATGVMTGVKLHDMNCGLKAYHSRVVKNIEVMGEMHRYIPVIAKFAGFKKIGEKPVAHQARKYGKSKFGMNRFVNGFLDLFTITFVGRFGKKPMHFFGALGSIMFLIGFILFLIMGIDKLFINTSGRLLAERAEFFISLTVMVMGTLFFIGGFLAELIIRNSPERGKYAIEQRLNLDTNL